MPKAKSKARLQIPAAPADGDPLPYPTANPDFTAMLPHRRSSKANDLTRPGPSSAQLRRMLTVAARVPDHGKLAPWRFVIFKGQARKDFGVVLAKSFEESRPGLSSKQSKVEAGRFLRAPVIVSVVSSPIENHKIPVWEQELSAGAVCQNLLVAAAAEGFAAQWITEWYAYDRAVKTAMGLAPGERVAGFVYIGTAGQQPTERKRPELDALITYWRASDQPRPR